MGGAYDSEEDEDDDDDEDDVALPGHGNNNVVQQQQKGVVRYDSDESDDDPYGANKPLPQQHQQPSARAAADRVALEALGLDHSDDIRLAAKGAEANARGAMGGAYDSDESEEDDEEDDDGDMALPGHGQPQPQHHSGGHHHHHDDEEEQYSDEYDEHSNGAEAPREQQRGTITQLAFDSDEEDPAAHLPGHGRQPLAAPTNAKGAMGGAYDSDESEDDDEDDDDDMALPGHGGRGQPQPQQQQRPPARMAAIGNLNSDEDGSSDGDDHMFLPGQGLSGVLGARGRPQSAAATRPAFNLNIQGRLGGFGGGADETDGTPPLSRAGSRPAHYMDAIGQQQQQQQQPRKASYTNDFDSEDDGF